MKNMKNMKNIYLFVIILLFFIPEFIFAYKRLFGKYHEEKMSNNIKKIINNNLTKFNNIILDDIFVVLTIIIYLFILKIFRDKEYRHFILNLDSSKRNNIRPVLLYIFIFILIILSIVFIYFIYNSKINKLLPELNKSIKTENTNNFDKEYKEYVYISSIRNIIFLTISFIVFLYYSKSWIIIMNFLNFVAINN